MHLLNGNKTLKFNLFRTQMNKRTFLFWICSLLVFNQFAQITPPEPKFINISKENGLPSSETYFVHQDRKGYIWICTDRGVVRYDGHRFRIFTKKEGLTDDVVFNLVEGADGKIWFVTMNSLLCYFEKEKIHPYKYNYLLKQHPSILSETIKHLQIQKDNSISYSFISAGNIHISSKGKKTVQNLQTKKLVIDFNKSELNFHMPLNYPFSVPMYVHKGNKTEFLDSIYLNNRFNLHKSKNHYIFTFKNVYYDLKTNKKYPLGDNIIFTHISGDSLFIGRYKKGYSIWNLKTKKWVEKNLQNGKSISSIFIDKNKRLWYSTLENGIYFAVNPTIKNYTLINGLTNEDSYSIQYFKNQVFIGYMSFGWQQLRYPFLKEDKLNNVTYTSFAANSDQLLINLPRLSSWNGNRFVPIPDNIDRYLLRYVYVKNNQFYANGVSILQIKNNKISTIYYENQDRTKINEKYFRIKAMFPDDSIIWKGTDNGLSYIKNNKTYIKGLTKKPFNSRITQLEKHPKWGLIAVTKGEGLFTFKDTTVIQHWTMKHGLVSDNINCLEITLTGDLLLGTNNGLNLVRKVNGKTIFHQITELNGLISNEINDITFANDTIWLATKKGICEFPIQELTTPKKEGNLFLESISQQSNVTGSFNTFFDANIPTLYIQFRTNDYASATINRFRYKINDEKKWTEINFPEVVLTNPIWGEYRLQFEYLDQYGKWISLRQPVFFEIDKPFWIKWYSILFYIVVSFILTSLIIRLRTNQIKRKERLQLQLIELEQRALQAQMNPHFIFNSLNSIQSFLVYQENEKAEIYLVKFAQLIRQILSKVNESNVPIREEIELLKTYLSLEKMRFKDKFEYSLTWNLIESEMDWKVPTMMIQPFVENAILHGFSTVKSGGILKIHFEKESDQLLTCIIDDNGIGRKKTESLKKEMNLSLSSKITQERISIFEKQFKGKFVFEIIDKPSDSGTIVRIQIPLIK